MRQNVLDVARIFSAGAVLAVIACALGGTQSWAGCLVGGISAVTLAAGAVVAYAAVTGRLQG